MIGFGHCLLQLRKKRVTDIKLHQFHGGLKPEDHKAESKNQGILTLPLSKKFIMPLKQHIGESNKPLLQVGDTVKKGQLIASSAAQISAPIHAPTSGVISEITQHAIPHPSGMSSLSIIIDADGQDQAEHTQSLNKNTNELDSSALLELIKQAGVVGFGGAAFPTEAKITSSHFNTIDTLIINGAECEPFITCDDMLMQTQAKQIIQGIAWLQKIISPKQTLIGIENNKPQAIQAMQQALTDANISNTTIAEVPTLYPSGGEKQLITVLTGKEVPSQKLAFDIGVICQNVGTCAAISQALDDHQAVISRVVTISGNGIKNPGNYYVRLGTPISDLIQAAGGYEKNASQLIMGGPMMGFSLPHDQMPITKSTNSILVLSEDFNPEQDVQACIRCAKCAEVCPAQLLPQQLYWYARAQRFDRIKDYHLFDCIECGCCSAVCPSQIPLVQYYRYAKGEIRIAEQEQKSADHARQRFEFRELRLAENKRKLEEARRLKREALAAKNKNKSDETKDSKQADPIQAALERVKAKQNAAKKNTTNLTSDQQRQIDEADKRRKNIAP